MLKRILQAAGLAGGLLLAGAAAADCVDGISVAEARQSYANGQQHEQAGRLSQAVVAYLAAQGYICGKSNPVALDAARRAVPLSRQLATEQEKQGNLYGSQNLRDLAAGGPGTPGAFQWFEAGGHYADADRVLITVLRARADDFALYDTARSHFEHRQLESFQSNNKIRLQAAGAYRPDPKLLAEVKAMPAAGVDRALANEQKGFSEDYLRDYVALWEKQSAPIRPMDFAAMQQAQQAEQGFRRKWRQDPLKLSQETLETGREWAIRSDDERQRERLEAKIHQRLAARAELIASKYSAAPELLQTAVDYYFRAQQEAKAEGVRRQADKLGDQAMAGQRFRVASAYYQVSGDTDKAGEADLKAEEALDADSEQNQERARQQAEEMRKLYSDPARVEAMRRQAEQMMKQMEKSGAQQQQFQQETDDLEDELDLGD